MALTLSFHQMANVAHREHNTRNPNAVRNMDHIDPSLHGGNLTIKDMKLRDAYEAAYGDSTRRFRQQQIEKKVRKSRLAKDYYTKVKEDARRNLCYEIVLQIGDRDSVGYRAWYTEEEKRYLELKSMDDALENSSAMIPSVDTSIQNGIYYDLDKEIQKANNAIIARETMLEYTSRWEMNNPNMYLYGAYLHADEKEGTLHMHLDYLPMATGYELGQDIQNGLERACKQNVEARLSREEIEERMLQHRKKTGKRMSYLYMWQDLQREELLHIAREKGLDLSWDRDSTRHQRHLDTPEYKAKMEELHDLDQKLQNQQEKIEKNNLLVADIMEEIQEKEETAIHAEGNLQRLHKELQQLEQQKEQLQEQSEGIREEADTLVRRIEKLKKESLKEEKHFKESQEKIQVLSESVMSFEEAEKKVKYYTELPRKTMFGNKIKLDAEEYADIMDTMNASVTHYHKMKQEADMARWAEKRAVREKNMAMCQKDRALHSKEEAIERAVERAVAPLENKIKDLKYQLHRQSLDLLRLDHFEWMNYLTASEREDIEKMREKVVPRMELKKAINEIHRKVELARQGDNRYDEYNLRIEEYDLLKENGVTAPKELLKCIERLEEDREEQWEMDER